MAQSKTYLEIVKDITLEVAGQVVYTLYETRESELVTQIVEDSYYKILDSRDWPYFMSFFLLTETSASTPTKMTLPADIKNVSYIKYDKQELGASTEDYGLVKYLEPQRFMNLLDDRTTGSINSWTNSDGIVYRVLDDTAPTYYTSPDEQTIIFDSYDSAVDSYLAAAKTQVYGMKLPTVTAEDTFTFDLPIEMFSLLQAEAKAISFRAIKGEANEAAELYVQSQRLKFMEKPWRFRNNYNLQDFTTTPTSAGVQQQQQTRRNS